MLTGTYETRVVPGVKVPVGTKEAPFAVNVIVDDELVPSKVPPVAIDMIPLLSAGLLAPVLRCAVAVEDLVILVVPVDATVIPPDILTSSVCVPEGCIVKFPFIVKLPAPKAYVLPAEEIAGVKLKLLKVTVPEVKAVGEPSPLKITVELPAVKVPVRVNNVPEVPVIVIFELLAVKVPADAMFSNPVEKAWLLPDVVSRVVVPDVVPVKVVVAVAATVVVPPRLIVNAKDEPAVGFELKFPFIVAAPANVYACPAVNFGVKDTFP